MESFSVVSEFSEVFYDLIFEENLEKRYVNIADIIDINKVNQPNKRRLKKDKYNPPVNISKGFAGLPPKESTKLPLI